MSLHRCTCQACRQDLEGSDAQKHRELTRLLMTTDERSRRLFVGFLARLHGRGGVSFFSRVTGMSRNTVLRGQRELQQAPLVPIGRLRQPGAGRPRVEKKVLRLGTP
jgi:hypothetical protein